MFIEASLWIFQRQHGNPPLRSGRKSLGSRVRGGASSRGTGPILPPGEHSRYRHHSEAGCLFRGEKTRVKFWQTTAKDLLIGGKERFDLIVLCDVIHHVRPACRK